MISFIERFLALSPWLVQTGMDLYAQGTKLWQIFQNGAPTQADEDWLAAEEAKQEANIQRPQPEDEL